eukprot:9015312-Karenia_brevis.AAC.1
MQMEQGIMSESFPEDDEPVVTPEPAAKKKGAGKKDLIEKAVENEFVEKEEKPKKKGPGKKDVKA